MCVDIVTVYRTSMPCIKSTDTSDERCVQCPTHVSVLHQHRWLHSNSIKSFSQRCWCGVSVSCHSNYYQCL